jgi:phosphoribosyl 1,2-cyclic phosphate phosphodiesterase
MELLFLGTGTSGGIPLIGCRCPVCTSSDPRDKRTRVSIVISHEKTSVLVDTTPELRLQCVNNGVESIDAIVYTHGHADHIMGLDDLRRFNFLKDGAALDAWADKATHEKLSKCFDYAFAAKDPDYKVSRPYLTRRFIDGPFSIGPMQWVPVPMMHGDLHVLGFRVGPIAYCTDVSLMPEKSFDLLHGLDVLVLDALQFSKRHLTHYTVEEAVEVARRIGATQTYFTHMAHGVSHESGNARLPAGMQFAYDGLRIAV